MSMATPSRDLSSSSKQHAQQCQDGKADARDERSTHVKPQSRFLNKLRGLLRPRRSWSSKAEENSMSSIPAAPSVDSPSNSEEITMSEFLGIPCRAGQVLGLPQNAVPIAPQPDNQLSSRPVKTNLDRPALRRVASFPRTVPTAHLRDTPKKLATSQHLISHLETMCRPLSSVEELPITEGTLDTTTNAITPRPRACSSTRNLRLQEAEQKLNLRQRYLRQSKSSGSVSSVMDANTLASDVPPIPSLSKMAPNFSYKLSMHDDYKGGRVTSMSYHSSSKLSPMPQSPNVPRLRRRRPPPLIFTEHDQYPSPGISKVHPAVRQTHGHCDLSLCSPQSGFRDIGDAPQPLVSNLTCHSDRRDLVREEGISYVESWRTSSIVVRSPEPCMGLLPELPTSSENPPPYTRESMTQSRGHGMGALPPKPFQSRIPLSNQSPAAPHSRNRHSINRAECLSPSLVASPAMCATPSKVRHAAMSNSTTTRKVARHSEQRDGHKARHSGIPSPTRQQTTPVRRRNIDLSRPLPDLPPEHYTAERNSMTMTPVRTAELCQSLSRRRHRRMCQAWEKTEDSQRQEEEAAENKTKTQTEGAGGDDVEADGMVFIRGPHRPLDIQQRLDGYQEGSR